MHMKFAHSIAISAFAKPGEDHARIKAALLLLIPFDIEKEKIKFRESSAEGFESKIVIYEAVLEKERHTNKFIESLKEKLSADDLHRLAAQENRVDNDCYFYLRLDKPKLLLGEYALTDSGDCFHVKMSIAAFPKKREAALSVVRKMLK